MGFGFWVGLQGQDLEFALRLDSDEIVREELQKLIWIRDVCRPLQLDRSGFRCRAQIYKSEFRDQA